jgi:hypothetical protein
VLGREPVGKRCLTPTVQAGDDRGLLCSGHWKPRDALLSSAPLFASAPPLAGADKLTNVPVEYLLERLRTGTLPVLYQHESLLRRLTTEHSVLATNFLF